MSDLVAGLPVWPAYARPPPAPVGRRRPASSAQPRKIAQCVPVNGPSMKRGPSVLPGHLRLQCRQVSTNKPLSPDSVAIDQRQQFVELKRLGKIRGRPDLRRPLGGIA